MTVGASKQKEMSKTPKLPLQIPTLGPCSHRRAKTTGVNILNRIPTPLNHQLPSWSAQGALLLTRIPRGVIRPPAPTLRQSRAVTPMFFSSRQEVVAPACGKAHQIPIPVTVYFRDQSKVSVKQLDRAMQSGHITWLNYDF